MCILVAVKTLVTTLFLLIAILPAAAQSHPSYRIKSWKTQGEEAPAQNLVIPLTAAKPAYRKVINDAAGRPLYRLMVQPAAFIGAGHGIVAWHVFLTGMDSSSNLLIPSNSLQQEEYETPDYLWWFYPGKNRFVPIDATRVVQLAGSYVVLKAGDIQMDAAGQLTSMQLSITFSNTPPASD